MQEITQKSAITGRKQCTNVLENTFEVDYYLFIRQLSKLKSLKIFSSDSKSCKIFIHLAVPAIWSVFISKILSV